MVVGHFENNLEQQGRVDANLNLTFEDQPEVAAYAAAFAPAIREDSGLHRPIPPAWLHCTVLWLGALDNFTHQELLEAALLMKPELQALRLPEFVLGPWWVDSGSVLVHLIPRDPLKLVYDIAYRALLRVVGPDRMPARKSFMPHVTLAYSKPKSYADELSLHARLSAVRPPLTRLRIRQLSLLEQFIQDDYFHNDYYAWRVMRQLALGQDD